jgi:hypothetical protein
MADRREYFRFGVDDDSLRLELENSDFSEIDDSDDDPSFDPNAPSTSQSGQHPQLSISSSSLSSESSNDEPPPKMRRGRPPGRVQVAPQSESSDDEINWTTVNEISDPEFTHDFGFHELPGPKHCPPTDASPIAYFDLFFTVSLLSMFVRETNRYASQFLAENDHKLSPRNAVRKWNPVSMTEVKAFIAVLLNMGIIKKPTIRSYWSLQSSQYSPWFHKMFSRTRFEFILRFFHLADNSTLAKPGHPDYNPCGKFEPLVNHCNNLFKFHFTPHQNLSVDESLIGTKNRTQILQYMPNKHHHKWGIKLWVMCDSVVNYCLGFLVYRGKNSGEDTEEMKQYGLGYSVVMRLLRLGNYMKKGYHVFVDNFFTSIQLAKKLYKSETFLTGTLRRNRKGVPKNFLEKFKVGEKKYMKDKYLLGLAYREKSSQQHPVIVISTNSTTGMDERVRRRFGRENIVERPKIISQYSKSMGGVDTNDMMLYAYLDERRSVKYWKKVTFNLFSRMVLNSYILYKMNKAEKPMSRLDFTISIIEAIEALWMEEKARGIGDEPVEEAEVRPTPAAGYGIQMLPGRKEKNCVVCSKPNNRKRSRTMCIRCNKGLHGQCMVKHTC